jgi:hypothetical protein
VGGKTLLRTCSKILSSVARTGEIISFSRKILTVRSCSLVRVSTFTRELRYGWLEVYVAYKTSMFPHCLNACQLHAREKFAEKYSRMGGAKNVGGDQSSRHLVKHRSAADCGLDADLRTF